MSRRSDLTDAITLEIRRQQVRVDAFDDTISIALGINRSDHRTLDVLDQEGPLPAGHLAKAVGLSTAAMTTVIDRLEARGFAARKPDPADRRRVLVEVAPEFHRAMWPYYAPLAELSEEVYAQFTDGELELLLRFLVTANERFAGMVDDLRARLAENPPPPRR
jgi:DNA-binding MarR family transcriptional regulator